MKCLSHNFNVSAQMSQNEAYCVGCVNSTRATDVKHTRTHPCNRLAQGSFVSLDP